MTWIVSQSGAAISGTATAATELGTVALNGTLSGTLTGTSLTFSISIAAGGISGFPGCSASIDGTATGVTASTISGTYTGTNSCSGAITAGKFTLTKK